MNELILKDDITAINWAATQNGEEVERIVISDSCISVDKFAFVRCINLKEIVVSETNTEFTSVDGILFSKDLKRIIKYPPAKESDSFEIPDSVEVIERGAFCDCRILNHVKIPESVIRIKMFAFAGCAKLERVDIPKNVEVIEQNAFYGCKGLKTFKMHPECKAMVIKPKDIYSGGFYGYCGMLFCCCNLEWLFLKDESTRPIEELKWILSKPTRSNGEYFISAGAALASNNEKKQIKIIARNVPIQDVPSDEKESYVRGFIAYADEYPETIAKGYFDYLRRTLNKWIPEVVRDTEFLRFMLQNEMVKKTKVDEVMEGIQKTGDVERTAMMMNYIQEKFGMGFDKYAERMNDKDKEEEKKKRQRERYEKKKIELAEKKNDSDIDLKSIWRVETFEDRKECYLSNYKGNAETLVIPETYKGCQITRIYKSQNFKSRRYAGVKEVILPNTIKEIGDNAFSNCLDLERIVIPDKVEIIGENAFLNCIHLESITLGKGLKRIRSFAFRKCEEIKEVTIPEGVDRIWDKGIFRECKNLEKIVFDNRKSIEFYRNGKGLVIGAPKANYYIHKETVLKDCDMPAKRIKYIEEE